MVRIVPIQTLDMPELAFYRTMKRPVEHHRLGCFVAEGEKVVRRLLDSAFSVVSLLVEPAWVPEFEPLLKLRPEADIPLYVGDKKVLEKLVGFNMYKGILAVARIPEASTLEAVLEASPSPRLFLAADGICNAENLGAIVRNAAAFGVHAVVVGETSSSPYLRRSVRGSMGTVFQMPVVEVTSLVETLGFLRKLGFRCVAAHPRDDRATPWTTDMRGDCCLVLGSEGPGLTPEVLAACDSWVAIPMAGQVDSLNVASASAVFLYEICRQRGWQPG